MLLSEDKPSRHAGVRGVEGQLVVRQYILSAILATERVGHSEAPYDQSSLNSAGRTCLRPMQTAEHGREVGSKMYAWPEPYEVDVHGVNLNIVKLMSVNVKIPCELIVWYVLPSIRRELARELVDTYHLSQAEVARRFGVTDAAISQYLKAKRGTSKEIQNSGKYEDFKKEIEASAVRMMNGSDIVTETCRICEMVKQSGMLVSVYETRAGVKAPQCVSCHIN
jgi:uncharacterized protein